jgi:hypothetical protein
VALLVSTLLVPDLLVPYLLLSYLPLEQFLLPTSLQVAWLARRLDWDEMRAF